MHGIQQLFRQHALEKESSIDSWSNTSEISPSSDISITMPNASSTTNWDQGNARNNSNKMDFDTSTSSPDKVLNHLHLASSPQPVPTKHLRSPEYGGYNSGNNRRAAYGRSPHNHVQPDYNFKRNTPTRKTSCEPRSCSPANVSPFFPSKAFKI